MIIFVKTLSGKTITLDVADTDTITSIKSQVAKRESVPVDKQRILFAGKDLDDKKTLAECGIKKESIVHLILKASEKNLSSYTSVQRKELEVAQTQVSQYYNPTVGLQDELSTYRDSESKFDTYANPQGAEYDLGKDGEFGEFVVLLGIFVGASLEAPIRALVKKGFRVISTSDEDVFIDNLPNADIAWILSAASPDAKPPYRRAYETVKKDQFVEAVLQFHKNGGGLFIWGDNDPLFEHANAVLPKILNSNVQLMGDTPANKTLKLGNGEKTGHFSHHIIFTGIISLYEGITISYPSTLGCLKVLATSTDAQPVICYADNEALKDDTVGRVVIDCGYTKNYTSWDHAGSARYIINATIWLLGLEHKVAHEQPIAGKNKNENFQSTVKRRSRLQIHTPQNTRNVFTEPSTPETPYVQDDYYTRSIREEAEFPFTSTTTSTTVPEKKKWWKFGK
eukprot:Phypoly_transcript_07953.p1 GENE.Phypoly_transcript_07953~~Phypoly_transcript_07953.p1  ORF type:complete len:453 (+),score=69.99 Phypoly_transcript_07953:65-1423(+)